MLDVAEASRVEARGGICEGDPGNDLVGSMWVEGATCLFQTKNQDGTLVIDDGVMRFA